MSATDPAPELDGIARWTVDLMETLGGPGAGLAIFIENIFPPIPSEVVLPMAGFAARLGDLSLAGAIIWTTIGSVAGAWVLYGLGAWLGHDRMRAIAARMPLVDVEDVDKTTAWFARHGTKAVFFGRMLPIFRSFISIPAGTERMGLLVFTLLTAAGSLIWNSIFVVAGYVLGANWHAVDPYASVLQYIVIGAVLVAVVWFLVGRVRRRRAQPAGEQRVPVTRGD
ncbi:DedA family protein [Promicromonospora sukumoe]|uniref:DedA family protein n=1 Tax=Promicromonospora sukumoe TaxID=88382 RepID=UPI0037C6ED4B